MLLPRGIVNAVHHDGLQVAEEFNVIGHVNDLYPAGETDDGVGEHGQLIDSIHACYASIANFAQKEATA